MFYQFDIFLWKTCGDIVLKLKNEEGEVEVPKLFSLILGEKIIFQRI